MSPFNFRKTFVFRAIAYMVLAAFIGLLPEKPAMAQVAIVMPAPGQMIHMTSHFEPPQMVGLKVDLKNPFSFNFIMDQGEKPMANDVEKEEFNKLIKYFLVSLAMPNKDMWVNLSPYESTRMIPQVFGQTEMGRDLLAQDYILKQFTASLMYPEDGLGKKFWSKVYSQAQERFGTTQINVNTFNKVWIVADHADVYQKDDTAILLKSHLKVMLEQDYMAIEKNKEMFGSINATTDTAMDAKTKMASQVVREIIIPAIEKEVNEGQSFAAVRQVYNAEIMATWFKKTLRQSLLGQVFANSSKISGQKHDDPQAMEKIYHEYLRAYKKGVFNYIKEDMTPDGQAIPRKYFSGGMQNFAMSSLNVVEDPTAAARIADASMGSIARKVVVGVALFAAVLAGGAAASVAFSTPTLAAPAPAAGKTEALATSFHFSPELTDKLVAAGFKKLPDGNIEDSVSFRAWLKQAFDVNGRPTQFLLDLLGGQFTENAQLKHDLETERAKAPNVIHETQVVTRTRTVTKEVQAKEIGELINLLNARNPGSINSPHDVVPAVTDLINQLTQALKDRDQARADLQTLQQNGRPEDQQAIAAKQAEIERLNQVVKERDSQLGDLRTQLGAKDKELAAKIELLQIAVRKLAEKDRSTDIAVAIAIAAVAVALAVWYKKSRENKQLKAENAEQAAKNAEQAAKIEEQTALIAEQAAKLAAQPEPTTDAEKDQQAEDAKKLTADAQDLTKKVEAADQADAGTQNAEDKGKADVAIEEGFSVADGLVALDKIKEQQENTLPAEILKAEGELELANQKRNEIQRDSLKRGIILNEKNKSIQEFIDSTDKLESLFGYSLKKIEEAKLKISELRANLEQLKATRKALEIKLVRNFEVQRQAKLDALRLESDQAKARIIVINEKMQEADTSNDLTAYAELNDEKEGLISRIGQIPVEVKAQNELANRMYALRRDHRADIEALEAAENASAIQPAAEQIPSEQPAAEQPAATQPAAGKAAATQPAAGQPAATQPAAGQPAATQPAAGQPAVTQPEAGVAVQGATATDTKEVTNHDVAYTDPHGRFAVIASTPGNVNDEQASALALATARQHIEANIGKAKTEADVEKLLTAALVNANNAVQRLQKTNDSLKGISASLMVVMPFKDPATGKRSLKVVHVGNNKLYVRRGYGDIRLHSTDDVDKEGALTKFIGKDFTFESNNVFTVELNDGDNIVLMSGKKHTRAGISDSFINNASNPQAVAQKLADMTKSAAAVLHVAPIVNAPAAEAEQVAPAGAVSEVYARLIAAVEQASDAREKAEDAILDYMNPAKYGNLGIPVSPERQQLQAEVDRLSSIVNLGINTTAEQRDQAKAKLQAAEFALGASKIQDAKNWPVKTPFMVNLLKTLEEALAKEEKAEADRKVGEKENNARIAFDNARAEVNRVLQEVAVEEGKVYKELMKITSNSNLQAKEREWMAAVEASKTAKPADKQKAEENVLKTNRAFTDAIVQEARATVARSPQAHPDLESALSDLDAKIAETTQPLEQVDAAREAHQAAKDELDALLGQSGITVNPDERLNPSAKAKRGIISVAKSIARRLNNLLPLNMRYIGKGNASQKAVGVEQRYGGINLSDENLTIDIKVDGKGMPLPAQFQNKAMLNLNGLTSVIRTIAPVTPQNVPALFDLLK